MEAKTEERKNKREWRSVMGEEREKKQAASLV
jgi:hypothetical protein